MSSAFFYYLKMKNGHQPYVIYVTSFPMRITHHPLFSSIFVTQLINRYNHNTMNIARNFGVLFAILGMVGMFYTGVNFAYTGGISTGKVLSTYGVLGVLFFSFGISLVRTTFKQIVINHHRHA